MRWKKMNQETMKIARSMKRPIVHISPNYMLGTDEEFCTLSVIEISSDIQRSFTTTVNDYLDESKIEKFSVAHPDIFFTEYQMIDTNFYINLWKEPYLFSNIFSVFNKIQYYLRFQIVYTEYGLEKNTEFMDTVAKLKVNDGLTRFMLGGKYMITSFNKVHAINASDKVSVNIYDIDPISFLCEFIVDKKKYTVKEYIRYRKMM